MSTTRVKVGRDKFYGERSLVAWSYMCDGCDRPSGLFPTWAGANRYADSHARVCKPLHLARLREQITDTAATLKDWSATSPDDNAFTRGANMAYAIAAKVLTEHTGITP